MNTLVETAIESARAQLPIPPHSQDDYVLLLERVKKEAQEAEEETRRQAHARAWELARRQGVKPIRNMAELKADFWPEEESVDEFLSWVRDLRQNDKPRSLPE